MKAKELARALVGRRWWWVTLLVIALMILLARLGVWQLDRLAQRRAANAQLMAAIEAPPVELNSSTALYSGMAPREVPPDLANHDVVAVGEFDFSNQYVLKLQSWNGRAGVHLITPFVLDGTDVAVLVNRGWIPDAEHAAGNAFDQMTGIQTVEGYIALTETISRQTADAIVPVSPGQELFRVDIAAVEAEMPYRLLPFYVRQSQPDGQAMELPIPVPKEVDLSEGPHMDYALQWFVFSAGLGIAYVIFVYRSLDPKDIAQQPQSATD